ncbi:MAG: FAD-dependent oxidoreductase [Alistipes sp.]|nr:FAD-dependent oxidoreductase [Alistipes sp.]
MPGAQRQIHGRSRPGSRKYELHIAALHAHVMKSGKVVIIGGGVAGMQAAATVRQLGKTPVILEKSTRIGGKLNDWHHLFPTFTPASRVLEELKESMDGVEIHTGAEVQHISPDTVTTTDGRTIGADAVIVASGFDIFPAELKEEYGYTLYDNVYTTVDLERMLSEGRVCLADGSRPRRIAFLHCVGSRDEKVNQRHCSRVCCITGVKQAIEMKRLFPEAEIYNFYMDIRMFGPGYEEMYRQAQEEYNINFIRGRISEAGETRDRRIQVKAEDTLIGRPLKMTVDMLILIVGMQAAKSNAALAGCPGVRLRPSGFMLPADSFCANTSAGTAGIFYAGTATAPKNIGESMNEGVAAAVSACRYIDSIG